MMAEGDDPLGCARQYIAAGADAILVDSYQRDKVGATGETMSLSLSRSLWLEAYTLRMWLMR